ncbi:tetratricopeptide repeat protein [Hallella bergensis]|uniref:tetratricopeptide repeat protein n=1 Tax=Hallella bergensis TaxID=242750 RepID=UPI0023F0EF8B|nr:tetratricopeptide repeat protein [Hallella bergensis]
MRTNILILLLALYSTFVWAQKFKRPDSYNYTRGVEAFQNNNADEAIEYLNKEIQEHQDNGYAYSYLSLLRLYREEYGQALTAANIAVKKIPSKDKEYIVFAYLTRAKVNLCLEDTIKALKDFGSAVDARPNDPKSYEARAQVYYEQGKYDLANADYQKMISLDEGDVMGYMGIGRNANAQKKWDDAIQQFDYVVKLASDYSSGYSFRAESYIGKKQYDKAIDDVIKALSMDGDYKAFYLLQHLADSAFVLTTNKLKVQTAKEPNESCWPYCLGVVHERKNRYTDAVIAYKGSLLKDNNPVTACCIANCYDDLGNYKNALVYCNQAIDLDSTDTDYIFLKANILNNAGQTKDAIEAMNTYLEKNPDSGFGYYRRGWFKDHSGDIDGAIEDYNMCITIIPEYAYCYLNRGVLYRLKGDNELAEKDFKQVIARDTVPGDNNTAHYAYYYLGEKDKAIEFMDKALKEENKGNYYDAACLYSIMGEKEKSIGYLRKALETGFRRFAHINRDRGLDNIRNEKEFIDLINEFEEKNRQEISADRSDEEAYEEAIAEIPFSKEGDMCKVKCAINGLPLHFIFDTGASDVSLSSVEATFMVKNGYLSSSDVIGKQHYLTASGEVSAGTVINLREVKFGNLHLDNIRASVVRNQSAPLLLGQSVLSKLGKIEIDNDKRNLKITYKLKK